MYGNQLAIVNHIICIYTDNSENSLNTIDNWCDENDIKLTKKKIGKSVKESDFNDHRTTVGVSVGGDGSFLQGVREFSKHKIPLLGINSGTLAFLPRVSPDCIEDALDNVINGRSNIASRQRYKVESDDITGSGINDVMIEPLEPENPYDRKICSLNVYVDGEYAGKYTGSGIAVSTPTGSTGIALSAGGPIHYPTNNHSLQIIPLNTHSMGVRPLVVSSESNITVEPESEVNVMLDGGRQHVVTDNEINVTGDDTRAYIIRTEYDDQFFDAMSQKLNWGIRDSDSVDRSNPRNSDKSRLEVAKDAVKSAGVPLREFHGKVENVEYKTDKSDIVTEADHRSEVMIETILSNHYPDDDIYSEESWFEDIDFEGTQWVIDPIDGTGNYMHGNPSYCVSVAYIVDGVTKIGVIYQPETDEMYYAKKGVGAYANDYKISTSDTSNLDESMLLSGYDPNGIFVQDMYESARGIRGIGSAALNLCYIASGSAEAVWEYDTYPWDVAAGILILEESGGKVTDEKGDPYNLSPNKDNKRPLVASNDDIHESITEKTKKLYDR